LHNGDEMIGTVYDTPVSLAAEPNIRLLVGGCFWF
jgi:hypothetical protein